jgi:CO/xanthine dehydrogenase FAD-binding subunit
VKPAPFRYAAPATLADALDLLADEDARPLAGGQSLVPMLNFRLARPKLLVDLNALAELAGLEVRGGALHIGALTRQTALLNAEVVAERWPLLRDAVSHVGHLAIRNRGTVGGSVAHADPAAELPVALSALDARLHLQSARGRRVVGAAEFFRGAMTTALQTGELLVSIEVPAPPTEARMGFAEHARTHGDFALAGVAVVCAAGRHAAIVLLGADVVPVRAADAERMLVAGDPPAEVASQASRAVEDVAGLYRRALLRTLTERVLAEVTA